MYNPFTYTYESKIADITTSISYRDKDFEIMATVYTEIQRTGLGCGVYDEKSANI
jgi:hypothetical protein